MSATTPSAPHGAPRRDERSGGLVAALAIARRDLLEFVRDRRTLFVTLLLPMVTYPIVALSSALGVRSAVSDLEAKNAPVPLVVAMSGPEAVPFAARIEAAVEEGRPQGTGKPWPSAVTFLQGSPDEGIRAVEDGQADVWIEAPGGLLAALDGTGTVELAARFTPRSPAAGRSREPFEAVIRTLAEQARVRRVTAAGLPEEVLRPLRLRFLGETFKAPTVSAETILPGLSGAILVLLTVLTMTGAFYPAIDAIAGEKERGTVETLLMAPCSAMSIVTGKFLAVYAVTLATLAANCLSIALTAAVSLRFLPSGSLSDVPGLWLGTAVTLVGFVGLSALAAATCLAVTTASKSGKEAQNTLTPVILLVTALAGTALVPGLRGDGALALVPFAGQVIVARDAFQAPAGEGFARALAILLPLGLSLAASAACTWLLLRATAWLLTDEEILFRGPDANPAGLLDRPPPRPVPSWPQAVAPVVAGLAGLWYVQGLSPDDLLLTIPIHQAVAVILPLALVRGWQRVDDRATFGLALPGGPLPALASTLGGTLLGAGGFLLSAALFLALFGAEPSEEVRSLSERLVALLRASPWWVSLGLVALLPAVAEELLFRGWLLAGLAGARPTRPRLAWALLLQAALFAVAHVLPERYPATFLLGLLAGCLRVASGSILPSIACHAVHNAVPVVLVALAGSQADGAAESIAAGTRVPPGIVALAAALVVVGATIAALAARRIRRVAAVGLAVAILAAGSGAAGAERVRVGVTNVGVTLQVIDGTPSGASIALWEDLRGRLGIEDEYVVFPSINAAMDAAAAGAVDLFLGPIAITRESEARLDFSHAVLHSGMRIAVRGVEPESWLGPLDILLSAEVLRLLAILAALTVIVGHLLWLFERRGNERSFPRHWPRGAWEGTWWGISTLLTGGCDDKHVDGLPGRVLALVWMIVGIGLVALFTGSLAATLTAERISGTIHGPRDLAGRVVATQAGGAASAAVRARAGVPKEFNTLDEAFAAADDGEVEAVVAENFTLRHAIARPSRADYRLVGPVFESLDVGIALAPGSPLRERLNAAILTMREDGAIESLVDRWLGGRE